MPRMPSYRLHKPSGQAVVTLAGRDYYLGAHDTPQSRERYDQLLGRWLLTRQAPPRPCDHAGVEVLTVAQLLLAWLKGYATAKYVKQGRPTSELHSAKRAVRFAVEQCGALPAADFDLRQLRSLRNALVKSGYARTYCNAVTSRLKLAWRWAAGEQLVPAGLIHELYAVRNLQRGEIVDGVPVVEAPPVLAVKPAIVEATLAVCTPTVRDLATVERLTGMRPCEVLGLRPCDLNCDGDLADGSRFAGVWVYDVPDYCNKMAHKGQARVVFLGPKAQAVLRPRLDRQPPPLSPLLAGDVGRGWYNRQLLVASERAGVEPWSPNQLRHLRATEIRSLYDPDAARTVLGHRLAGVTGRYAEADLAKAARVMREIG